MRVGGDTGSRPQFKFTSKDPGRFAKTPKLQSVPARSYFDQ